MKQKILEIGSVYGRLTVIGNTMVGRYSSAICKCECGNIKTIRRYSLTHGDGGAPTRSCGCLMLETARVVFRCDRGSSFESPLAYAEHRKKWIKEYAKAYDSRPEQRAKRAVQAKPVAQFERDSISDSYALAIFIRDSGISRSNVSKEIIEVVRQRIRIHRLLKEIQIEKRN